VGSDLNPAWAPGNLFWGMAYVLLGPAVLFIVWCVQRCA